MTSTSIPKTLGDIVVRYMCESDYSPYISLEKNEEAKRYVGGPNTRSAEDILVSLKTHPFDCSLLVIADSKTNEYLGRCGFIFSDNSNKAELFIVLKKSARKKGFGALIIPFLIELASNLKLKPYALIDPNNIASIKLLQKLEWTKTGLCSNEGKQNGHLLYEP